MWNPSEYIEDMMALGHSRQEATSMAREEAQLRRLTARRNSQKQATREINEGRRPHLFTGGYRGGRE